MNSTQAFILDSIKKDKPLGETEHFVWFITDIGIASLFKGEENFKFYNLNVEKEAKHLSLDISKEEKEYCEIEEKKDSKKCSGKKNIMFTYGFIQLGSSFVSAIALAAIAFGFCSVKKESKLFNKCVAEIIEDGNTNSEAVRYCNGGN